MTTPIKDESIHEVIARFRKGDTSVPGYVSYSDGVKKLANKLGVTPSEILSTVRNLEDGREDTREFSFQGESLRWAIWHHVTWMAALYYPGALCDPEIITFKLEIKLANE